MELWRWPGVTILPTVERWNFGFHLYLIKWYRWSTPKSHGRLIVIFSGEVGWLTPFSDSQSAFGTKLCLPQWFSLVLCAKSQRCSCGGWMPDRMTGIKLFCGGWMSDKMPGLATCIPFGWTCNFGAGNLPGGAIFIGVYIIWCYLYVGVHLSGPLRCR